MNKSPKKEKPWTIHSWPEFRAELSNMRPRSKLFETIKAELQKRGHWKNAKRGIWAKKKK